MTANLSTVKQGYLPVTVVDDFLHQVLRGFFSGGVLLGDVPEAVVASFDVELVWARGLP